MQNAQAPVLETAPDQLWATRLLESLVFAQGQRGSALVPFGPGRPSS